MRYQALGFKLRMQKGEAQSFAFLFGYFVGAFSQ